MRCAPGPRSSSTATGPRRWCGPRSCSSWQRSQPRVSRDVSEAPLDDESDARAFWRDSPLQERGRRGSRTSCGVRREDGDLVLAVTDAQTRILWTYGGRVMRRKAESVNFVPGRPLGRRVASAPTPSTSPTGCARPSMVFSAEHYAPIVHNWVCWAAPVHDPVTGAQLGVIDLSTTWDRTHPIGLATARVLARLIETAMPLSHDAPDAARRRRPDRAPAPAARQRRGHARRQPAAAQPAADRDPRDPRAAPRRALARPPARAASTATRPSPSRRSRPRCRTCAPRSAASSPRGPTG